MSDEDEAKSTHSMVVGLHRRFNDVERDLHTLAQDSKSVTERMIRMEGRIDIAEVKAHAAAEREAATYQHVQTALEATNHLVRKLFDKFDTHTVEEAADRKELFDERQEVLKEQKRVLWWVITTCLSMLSAIAMWALTEVFSK